MTPSRFGNIATLADVFVVAPDGTALRSNALSLLVTMLPCTEVGTTGNDVLYGTPGRDKICGRTGAA